MLTYLLHDPSFPRGLGIMGIHSQVNTGPPQRTEREDIYRSHRLRESPAPQSRRPARDAKKRVTLRCSGQELLSLLVERGPLLDHGEALDLQERTCLVAGHDPRVLLPQGAPLLAHDTPRLVLHEVRLLQPGRGLRDLPEERAANRCRDMSVKAQEGAKEDVLAGLDAITGEDE